MSFLIKQWRLKMTNLAKRILTAYNSGATDVESILSLDIGSSDCEVAFIIEQLKCKGFIDEQRK